MRRFTGDFHALACARAFTVVELLVVLAVLAVCLLVAIVALPTGLALHAARGAAQCWQAAAASAQLEVMWRGGSGQVDCDAAKLVVTHVPGIGTEDLSGLAPTGPVSTNTASWRIGDGVAVRFSGAQASPNGGGSLYFKGLRGAYRVVVRPESGLTVRISVGETP